MSFEEGNQIWRVRATHGREVLIKSPGKLWDAAIEYFEWCTENPIEVTDYRGKDALPVKLKTVRPFTIREFAVFVDASNTWWRQFKKSKTVEESEDFQTVISRIEDVMFSQKFTGAAIGIYKENLISRELGLRDAVDTDVTSKGESIARTVIKWGDNEIQV